jgi:thienamycin biosynthesis protein ThnN
MMQESKLRALDAHYLNTIVQLHCDESTGAAYWSQRYGPRLRSKGGTVASLQDFKDCFVPPGGPAQVQYEEDLRTLPIETFVPRSVLDSKEWLWASETGGTTGIAKRGTWGQQYWSEIMQFSDEFLDLHTVGRNCNWLYIGPTGPHTTGRLMVSIAERRGGRIFTIDMDPRIVRVYLRDGDTHAVDRYIRHLWEQVDPIIRYQRIGVLFCTATLLEMLPRYVDAGLLDKVGAVVHAGLAMSRDTHRYLREELFPKRPVVGIYGTSVSGISFQKPFEPQDDFRIIYIPCQPYVVLEAIRESGELVDYGQEGDVRCFRFTRDQLIPGFVERDRGTRIEPFGAFRERYPWDWLGDPHSPASLSGQKVDGVY